MYSQWQSSYRNHVFDWWALLFAGNLDLALKADPSLRMVHIWNEPDIVSLSIILSCCFRLKLTIPSLYTCCELIYLHSISQWMVRMEATTPTSLLW